MIEQLPKKEDFFLSYVVMDDYEQGELLAAINPPYYYTPKDGIPVDNLINGSPDEWEMFEMCYPGLGIETAVKAWCEFDIEKTDTHYWISLGGRIT